MTTEALIVSLLRDYEQSGRVLYLQMLAQLPRLRRWVYTQGRHYRLLGRLEQRGRVIVRRGAHSFWYRKA